MPSASCWGRSEPGGPGLRGPDEAAGLGRSVRVGCGLLRECNLREKRRDVSWQGAVRPGMRQGTAARCRAARGRAMTPSDASSTVLHPSRLLASQCSLPRTPTTPLNTTLQGETHLPATPNSAASAGTPWPPPLPAGPPCSGAPPAACVAMRLQRCLSHNPPALSLSEAGWVGHCRGTPGTAHSIAPAGIPGRTVACRTPLQRRPSCGLRSNAIAALPVPPPPYTPPQ